MNKKHIGRRIGSKNGDGATQPLAFEIVLQRHAAGGIAVRIGGRPYPTRGREVSLLAAAIVTIAPDGQLRIAGHGVVRKHGSVISIVA